MKKKQNQTRNTDKAKTTKAENTILIRVRVSKSNHKLIFFPIWIPKLSQMRRNCCHISLAFVLKLLNFLQAFVGVSIIVYSLWMLNQWNHHIPISPPSPPAPSAPSPSSSSLSLFFDSSSDPARGFKLEVEAEAEAVMVSGFDGGFGFETDFTSFQLPAPW